VAALTYALRAANGRMDWAAKRLGLSRKRPLTPHWLGRMLAIVAPGIWQSGAEEGSPCRAAPVVLPAVDRARSRAWPDAPSTACLCPALMRGWKTRVS